MIYPVFGALFKKFFRGNVIMECILKTLWGKCAKKLEISEKVLLCFFVKAKLCYLSCL